MDSAMTFRTIVPALLLVGCSDNLKPDGQPLLPAPSGSAGCELTMADAAWPGPGNESDWTTSIVFDEDVSFMLRNFSCQIPSGGSRPWPEEFTVERSILRHQLDWVDFGGTPITPSTSQIDMVLDSMMSTWNSVSGTGVDLYWEDPAFAADADLGDNEFSSIGVGEISLSEDVLAETDHHVDSEGNLTADIYFFKNLFVLDAAGNPQDEAIDWALFSSGTASSYSASFVGAHEMGHAHGLNHNREPNSIMYEAYAENNGLTASDDDSSRHMYN